MINLIASFRRYFILAVLSLILFFLLWLKFFVGPRISQNLPLPSSFPSPTVVKENMFLTEIKPPQNPFILPGNKISFIYKGRLLNVPSKLPVYKPQKTLKLTLNEAEFYAKIYNFLSPPQIKRESEENPFFLWQEKERVLSVGGLLPVVHFNNYTFLRFNSSPSGLINHSFFIDKSRQELDKLNIRNVDYENPVFFFFKTVAPNTETGEIELLETTSINDASYFGIGLTYQLNGIRIISNAPRNLPIFLIFDEIGNLFELTVYLFVPEKQPSTVKTIPFEESISKLDEKAIVFSLFSEEDLNKQDIPPYNIKSIDLSSAEVVYYLPIDYTANILPYYLFRGNTQNEFDKKVLQVLVLLPAIPEP